MFSGFRRQLPFLLAFVLVAWMYVWTVRSNNLAFHFGEEQHDYYNLLVHGFLKGQLNLDAAVAPPLANVANPYDPAQRPSGVPVLHDASLYHGKYYIYYGVVPAVVALLPFRVVTGIDLPVPFAIVGFALLAYGTMLWLLADLRARFYPRCGGAMAFLIAIAVGFATCAPLLLRRSSMYELPITCGGFCAMMALASLYRVLVRGASTVWGLAAASLLLGLAVGSRPTYILTPFVFGAVVWSIWKGRAATPATALSAKLEPAIVFHRLWLAALLPMAIVGLALAWYNYARFGNPTEFGVSYILSGVYESKIEHFRSRYFGWNAYAYFLAPGEWGRYFPFFHPKTIALPRPAQHYGMDHPFGLFVNVPLVWLGVFAGRRRERPGGSNPLRIWLLATVGCGVAVCLVVFSFYAAMARYLGDFAPAFALVGATGALALCDATDWPRAAARLARGAVLLACAATAFIVFFVSVEIYSRLRVFNPNAYNQLARFANAPIHGLESLAGEPHGPVTLRFEFPSSIVPGRREELLRTGWSSEKDRLLLTYVDARHAKLVFEHTGAPPLESAPLPVDSGAHDLSIAFGSFFPPTTWRGYEGWSPAQIHALTRWLEVRVDGVVVLQRYQRFYPASAGTVVLAGRGRTEPFSGRILNVRWQGVSPPRGTSVGTVAVRPTRDGTVPLLVRFPAGVAGQRDPIVVTGETGRGDFIAVEYLGPDRLRFFVDHWGGGGPFSEPIRYEPGRAYRLAIRHQVFAATGDAPANSASDLVVSLDDRVVWRVPVSLYAIAVEDIYVGFNPIGGSGCGEWFSGTIEAR